MKKSEKKPCLHIKYKHEQQIQGYTKTNPRPLCFHAVPCSKNYCCRGEWFRLCGPSPCPMGLTLIHNHFAYCVGHICVLDLGVPLLNKFPNLCQPMAIYLHGLRGPVVASWRRSTPSSITPTCWPYQSLGLCARSTISCQSQFTWFSPTISQFTWSPFVASDL